MNNGNDLDHSVLMNTLVNTDTLNSIDTLHNNNHITDLDLSPDDIVSQVTHDLNNLLLEDHGFVSIAPDFDIPIYSSHNKPRLCSSATTLVLSGGGIRGIAHVGALNALHELDYLKQFTTFAAASVGSFVIGMYTIGYTPDELWHFVKSFDFGKVKSINMLNMLHTFGIDSGIKFEYVLKRLIEAKGFHEHITLRDVYDYTKKTLTFSTVCVNQQAVVYLSHESHPNLPLWLAIRMSASIPLFYTPVLFEGNLYIDGGCIDNYPIQLFHDNLDDVLGIYLIDSKNSLDHIEHLDSYIMLVLQCLMIGVAFNSKKGYERNTLSVNLDSISIIDFEIDLDKKKELFLAGYNQALAFFN